MNTNILKLFSLVAVIFGMVQATAAPWSWGRKKAEPTPISTEPNCSFNLSDEDAVLAEQLVDAGLLGPIDLKEIASVTPVQIDLDRRYATWPLARRKAVWWTIPGKGQIPAKILKMWSGRIMVILEPDLITRAELLPVPGMTAVIYDRGRLLYSLGAEGRWNPADKKEMMLGALDESARVLVKETVSAKGGAEWTFYSPQIPGRLIPIQQGETVELEDGRRLVQGTNGIRVAPARGAIRVLAAQSKPPLADFLSWAQVWLENYTWDQGFPKLEELAQAVVTRASVENDPRQYIAFVGPEGPRDRWVRLFEYPNAKHAGPYELKYPRVFLDGGLPLIHKDDRWFLRDDDPGVAVEPARPKVGPKPNAAAPMAFTLELAD